MLQDATFSPICSSAKPPILPTAHEPDCPIWVIGKKKGKKNGASQLWTKGPGQVRFMRDPVSGSPVNQLAAM
jgi:hypothetical protein